MEQTAKPAEAVKPKGKTMWVAVAAVVIIIIVVAGLYFAGIFPGGGGGGATKAATIVETTAGTCPNSTNCYYTPNPLNIARGDKVTWTNNVGNIPHTVTACSTANAPDSTSCPTMNNASLPSFDSGSAGIGSGGTYTPSSNPFTGQGTYYYYCRFHNFMHGQVVVS